MTLRSRLLLAQLPLAASLVLVGLLSRSTIFALARDSQAVLKNNYLSVLAAEHMRDDVDDLDRIALAQATGEAPAPAPEKASALRAAFERELEFQEHNVTEAGEDEMTARLRARWNRYQAILQLVLAAPEAAPETRARYFRELLPARVAVERAADEIIVVNQDAMVRKSEGAGRRASRIAGLMLAATLGACLLGLVASTVLTSRLVRPLSVLSQAVRRLGEGDLEARAKLEGHDEIAHLATEFNTMADRLRAYRLSSLGELLQAQRASQAAIDSLTDPVLVLDASGGLLNVNQAAETLFGLSMVAGTDEAFARADAGVRETVARMKEHIGGGKGACVPRGLEEAVGIPTPDGTRFFLARSNPVLGEEGGVVGLTILFQDVTRLRRFDELKNDLVATVAHEFRTPLTSLRMAIHLCAEETVGPLTPKQADLLYAAREDCERLQAIVDDLLDLSRIQAGRIELHTRAVAPRTLMEEAIESHRMLARERQVALAVADSPTERAVLADPERLHLVLTNLVVNALRHTPAGGRVELRATAEEGRVRFAVVDTGVGIAPEYLPRLFERFFRVPGAPPGGAGLGLYIAKEIAEAHGGQIGVESAPGEGSTFWFTVPAAPPGSDSSTGNI